MGPLAGTKVVELTGLGPAPFCAMMLGDMGADVVRIDRIGGHPSTVDARKNILDRSRRSVGINLKSAAGVDTALRLIEHADALVEGFRPGVMERLGLGPDVCLEKNPSLVYGRVTGWGQFGPLAQSAGHDINYLGLTGALSAIGSLVSGPVPPLNIVADFGAGGMLLTNGILAGLLQAKTTGIGQIVDAAMTDGVPLLMGTAHTLRANGRWEEGTYNNLVDGGAYFYTTYECADGQWIAVGAIETQFHRLLLDKLGLTEAPEFQDPSDSANWPAAKARLAKVFQSRDRSHWEELLGNTDACFAPVLTMADAPEHPHNIARETFIEVGGVVQAAPAPRFSKTPSAKPTASPLPGEHNQEALLDWGFSQEEVSQLLSDSIVG